MIVVAFVAVVVINLLSLLICSLCSICLSSGTFSFPSPPPSTATYNSRLSLPGKRSNRGFHCSLIWTLKKARTLSQLPHLVVVVFVACCWLLFLWTGWTGSRRGRGWEQFLVGNYAIDIWWGPFLCLAGTCCAPYHITTLVTFTLSSWTGFSRVKDTPNLREHLCINFVKP